MASDVLDRVSVDLWDGPDALNPHSGKESSVLQSLKITFNRTLSCPFFCSRNEVRCLEHV
jgi:hypothetical protein